MAQATAQRNQHYSAVFIANPASEIEGCRTNLESLYIHSFFSRFFTNQLWIHAILVTSENTGSLPQRKHMKSKMLCTLQSCLGIVVSVACAFAFAKLFSRTHWKLAAPFLFAVVLVLLAGRFGAAVSVVGSVLAAGIFALMLFAPLRSFRVEDDSARATLAWMILLSISASYLLFPSRSGGDGL
jgi:K+-sensing histidine kinase KdpD